MCVALTLIEPCPPAGSGLMSLLRYWSPDTAASLGGAPLTVCVYVCVCMCAGTINIHSELINYILKESSALKQLVH